MRNDYKHFTIANAFKVLWKHQKGIVDETRLKFNRNTFFLQIFLVKPHFVIIN